eukprot:2966486-Rhodomonas_salina.3
MSRGKELLRSGAPPAPPVAASERLHRNHNRSQTQAGTPHGVSAEHRMRTCRQNRRAVRALLLFGSEVRL